MGNLGDAIDNIYEKFLLRDVLSFFTPGAVVVTSVLLIWISPSQLLDYLKNFHWLLYIPIFGFVFMVGFAVQSLGAKFPPMCFRLPPLIRLHWHLHGRNSCQYNSLKDFYTNHRLPFQRKVDEIPNDWVQRKVDEIPNDWERKRLEKMHERLAVFKQMCGNGAFAISIASIIFSIKYNLLALIGLLLAVLLYCGHIHAVRQEGALEEAVLGK